MRFLIESVLWWTAKDLLKYYPCLQQFNIEIDKGEHFDRVYIRLDNIAQLKALVAAVGEQIIVNEDFDSIKIYDNYIE